MKGVHMSPSFFNALSILFLLINIIIIDVNIFRIEKRLDDLEDKEGEE